MSTDWIVLRRFVVSSGRWMCWTYPRIFPWPFPCLLLPSQIHKSPGSGFRSVFLFPFHYGSDAGTRTSTLGFYLPRSPLCLWACRLLRFPLPGSLATFVPLANADPASTDSNRREYTNSGIFFFRDDHPRSTLCRDSTISDLGWHLYSFLPNIGPATTNLYQNANSDSNLADDPISPPHLLPAPPPFSPHLLSAPPALSGPSAPRVLHILSRTRSTSPWSSMLGVGLRSFL